MTDYEYRVSWQREGRRRKFVRFATRPAAERRAAKVAGETDDDLHWQCDESHGYTNLGPEGIGYSCMPPVIGPVVIEERRVFEWHPLTVAAREKREGL